MPSVVELDPTLEALGAQRNLPPAWSVGCGRRPEGDNGGFMPDPTLLLLTPSVQEFQK